MTGPSLLYAVKQVELAVRAHLDDLLRPAGITALQYTALTVLQRSGSSTSAALARHSFVTTQSIADLVQTLERRAVISRTPDPLDRRQVQITLTPAGQALLDDYGEAVAALEQRMVRGLSKPQTLALGTALNRCRSNLAEER